MTDGTIDGARPNQCPKCGRPLNTSTGAYAGPTWPGEECSWCATGHGLGYVSDWEEPDWFVGRWLARNRFVRWLRSGWDG
jgi:hypothetical protein